MDLEIFCERHPKLKEREVKDCNNLNINLGVHRFFLSVLDALITAHKVRKSRVAIKLHVCLVETVSYHQEFHQTV